MWWSVSKTGAHCYLCTSVRKTPRFGSILAIQRSCRKVGVVGSCLRVWISAHQAGSWDDVKYSGYTGCHLGCSCCSQSVAPPCVCVCCASGAAPQVSGITHPEGFWHLVITHSQDHLCNLEIPGGRFSIYFSIDCVCEWSLTWEIFFGDCIRKSV